MMSIFVVILCPSIINAEALFEHHITSDSIKHALADMKDSEKKNVEKVGPLDLSKVNSSIIKPKMSFDLIDETLVKIEQQIIAISLQLNQLKEHVIEVKRVACQQADEEKTKTDRLTAQLQETGKQLAAKTLQVDMLHVEIDLKRRQIDVSLTATDTPAHVCTQDPDHSEQHAQQ